MVRRRDPFAISDGSISVAEGQRLAGEEFSDPVVAAWPRTDCFTGRTRGDQGIEPSPTKDVGPPILRID